MNCLDDLKDFYAFYGFYDLLLTADYRLSDAVFLETIEQGVSGDA